MAASRETQSLNRVLVHEGGWSNNPRDPGGPTMKGVTQRVYDAYRKGKGLKTHSVKTITQAELLDIYDRQYWDPIKGDQLPDGVDYVVFDGAVNSGVDRSIRWLQQALQPQYKGAIDGQIGALTFAAIEALGNNDLLIDRICDIRLNFLRHLSTWSTFGKGWTARVAEVRAGGQAWATGAKPEAATPIENASAKALVSDAVQAPATVTGDAGAGAGVGAGGAAVALQTVKDQIAPYTDASHYITYAVVGLSLLGLALVLGGGAWSYYARRRAAKLATAMSVTS